MEIAAYKDDSAHYVKGIHQPLISEAQFDEVQGILHGRKRVMKVRSLQIDKLKQRIQNAQALMLDAELTVTEYKDVRNALAPEIDVLERRKVALLTSEDDYQEYLDKGIPMLQNIDKHWLAADLSGKQHIVGSILLPKLVFEKNSYRTIGESPVLALIAATGADWHFQKVERSAYC